MLGKNLHQYLCSKAKIIIYRARNHISCTDWQFLESINPDKIIYYNIRFHEVSGRRSRNLTQDYEHLDDDPGFYRVAEHSKKKVRYGRADY